MNPEISRRKFLAFGGAALVTDTTEQRDAAVPWWADCATSPGYRHLARATLAGGLIVSASERGSYNLSFIDDDFPVSKPISMPRAQVQRELQVVGTVQYEMSLVDAASGRASLVIMFQEPAHVTVYADESKRGGVVIVAAEVR